MEEKKVICHSGGVFHKAEDGSLSYSGSNPQATCIHNQMTFDEFQIEVAEMFGRSSIGNMSFKYFIPGYSKTLITISNDKGLRNMIKIHRDSVAIELYIMTNEMLPLDVSNMQQCIRSSRTTLPEAMAPADASLNIIDNAVDDTNAIAPVIGFGDTNYIDITIEVSPTMPRSDPNDARLWENSITGVGQRFNSVDELRDSIRKYAFARKFAFRFKKNDSDRVIVKCKIEGCLWGIHALRLPESELFCIKKMTSDHNCGEAAKTTGHQATSRVIAGFIEEKLKVLPNYCYKIKDIVGDFKQKHGIPITYQQARRAKMIADGRAKMIADGIEITNQPARRVKMKADGTYQPARRVKKKAEHHQLPRLCEMTIEENITPELIAPVNDYVESHIDRPIEISPMMPRGDCRSPLLGVMTIEEEEHRQSPRLCEMTIEEEEHRQSPLLGVMTIEEEEHRQSPLLGVMTIEEEEHRQSPRLCEMIIEENPGSLATFTTKDDSTFPGRFFAFRASLSGFQQGCRPLLFLDSILLHSNFLLFTASTVDGDIGDLPIAFAVVDRETENNWHWFLLQLKGCLTISCPFTFYAHRRLKESISNVFPGSFHSFCENYLIDELFEELKEPISRDVQNQIERYCYDACSAFSPKGFHESLERIKGISSEAYNWISKIEPTNWANAFFPGEITHNRQAYSSTFRSEIREACEEVSSVTHLVHALEVWTNKQIIKRQTASAQWMSRLTPYMEKLVEELKQKARYFQVLSSAGSTYEVWEVFSYKEVDMEVDIENRNCSCGWWQNDDGIPCSHALAVIRSIDGCPYEYCSRYFTTEYFRLTYSFN